LRLASVRSPRLRAAGRHQQPMKSEKLSFLTEPIRQPRLPEGIKGPSIKISRQVSFPAKTAPCFQIGARRRPRSDRGIDIARTSGRGRNAPPYANERVRSGLAAPAQEAFATLAPAASGFRIGTITPQSPMISALSPVSDATQETPQTIASHRTLGKPSP
jgi:hypothetical protein